MEWCKKFNVQFFFRLSDKGIDVGICGRVGRSLARDALCRGFPAGGALEVWPWTSVLNSLVG